MCVCFCVCLQVIDPFESSDPSRWPDEYTRQQLIEECRESSAGPFILVNNSPIYNNRVHVSVSPSCCTEHIKENQVACDQYKCLLSHLSVYYMLMLPLCPHGGAVGAGRASVWHSQPAHLCGSVRVPAAAAGEPTGRRQHPGAGESLPERRERHSSLLLPETSTQTHPLSSGKYSLIYLLNFIFHLYL